MGPVKRGFLAGRPLKLEGRTKPKFVHESRSSQIMKKLPKVQPYKIHLDTGDPQRVPRFRFAESGISHLTKPSTIFETTGGRKTGHTSVVRLPLGKRVQLLQDLAKGARHANELKQLLAIPRLSLSRFVKNGLLRTTWGPSGVGVYFEITSKGRRELRRLETALARSDSMGRKNLIHLKQVTAYVSG